jgi:hypothetical protein
VNPKEALLFREGWRVGSGHPFELFLQRRSGRITEKQFERGLKAWEAKTKRPLDPTKQSCCYGESRFKEMVQDVAAARKAAVLEIGTMAIPLSEVRRLDPGAKPTDLDDAWEYGLYLHLYGARYAVLQKLN